MRLNADFDQRVVIRPEAYDWVASPASGVERMMLDRVGDEVARATSLVRFAPNSSFDAHTHGGGEEYLVLDGVFSDEDGDYPRGTYVRNPIGTRHTPRIGPEGATILVKLRQFDPDDDVQKVVRTDTAFDEVAPGLSQIVLHEHGPERVRMVRSAPGTQLDRHAHPGGEELFVLEGSYSDEDGHYPAGTWLRSPVGTGHAPWSDEGCLLWIKTGHLAPVIGADG